MDSAPAARKLNIGSGRSGLPGYESIDVASGRAAYPLDVPDTCVDAIRASHILEHFPEAEIASVLADWNRVLRPGGTIEIAVPDIDKIMSAEFASHPQRLAFLMGGQTHPNDFHRAAFTAAKLRGAMHRAGFDRIRGWKGDPRDTSSHPISLNLRGVKGPRVPITGKFSARVKAVMSVPRFGSNDAWSAITRALAEVNVPLETMGGVFWGQCMQRMFERALDSGVEWLLTIDFDSIFTAAHVRGLFRRIAEHPEVDAICAMQKRRMRDEPLMSMAGKSSVVFRSNEIRRIDTGHFGLTALRVAALAKMPKPWFHSQPKSDGTWGVGRVDDDIMFWRKWQAAGNSLFVDFACRIGHLEVVVYEYNEKYAVKGMSAPDWMQREYGDAGIIDDPREAGKTVANVPQHSAGRPRRGAVHANRGGAHRQGSRDSAAFRGNGDGVSAAAHDGAAKGEASERGIPCA